MNHRPKGRCFYGPPSAGHMRAYYVARWNESTRSNLRDVPSRVAVAVGEDNTFLAREPVPPTGSELTAARTRSRRIRRIDVEHRYARAGGLVLDELLQLPPSPAMQARSNALAGLDPVADVGQVLQRNRTAAARCGFAHDRRADLVIDVARMARLSTGDSGQQLSCRLRAVALKPRAQRQKPIARISKLSTSVQTAAAGRGRDILSQVYPEYADGQARARIGHVQDDVQTPAPAPENKLGLLDRTALQIHGLKRPYPHRDVLSPRHREDRDCPIAQTIGASVDMHRRIVSKDDRLPGTAVGSMGFEAARDRGNRVTSHLRTEARETIAHAIVGQMVQPYAIGGAVLQSNAGHRVARGGKSVLQRLKFRALRLRWMQGQAYRSLHAPNCSTTQCHQGGSLKREGRFLLGLNAEVSAPMGR
jgi:hypothetical protein